MNAESIERLLLKTGEQPTAAHLQQLDAAIAAQRHLGGRNVRRRVFPWGTHEHYVGGGGSSYVSPYFEPSVGRKEGAWEISWQRGLIAGIEPMIGERLISDSASVGPPVFSVPDDAFGDTGEALIYFRLVISPAWAIEKIEPYATAETPLLTPWRADKLALILSDDGSVWRALVSNQGWLAVNRRASGLAQHLWWSRM